MPDFYLHNIFGESVNKSERTLNFSEAFHMGLQGPDAFAFVRRRNKKQCPVELVSLLHNTDAKEILNSMVRYCKSGDNNFSFAAEAYLYGFAAHYCLDRRLMPYITAMSEKTNMSEENITKDVSSDMVAYLEIGEMSTKSINAKYTLTPVEQSAIANMLTYVIYDVYQILAASNVITDCFNNMLKSQLKSDITSRIISSIKFPLKEKPKSGEKSGFMEKLKREKTANSEKLQYISRSDAVPLWDSLNLYGEEWKNPYSGEITNLSVPKLMDMAADDYIRLQSVLEKNIAGAQLPIETGLDFYGKRVTKP